MIGQRKEKPRLQRVEKPTIPSLAHTLMSATGESSELGWIISYADLLMILLCFFVLFYSSSPETEGSVIQKILNMESKELQQNQGSTVLAVPAELNANSVLLKKLSINLSSFDLNTKAQDDSIVIQFPDNSFGKGKSNLGAAQKDQLVQLIERLKPFQNDVNITLIGHTDSSAVSPYQKNGILDNFDLSAARAKSAYKIVIQANFPESHIKIEGDSSFERASRTLSVMIKPRAEK